MVKGLLDIKEYTMACKHLYMAAENKSLLSVVGNQSLGGEPKAGKD